MTRMNRESYIGIGVAIAIFLLVLPLVINNGLSHQYVSNSSLDKFNNYTGVTVSYYAAIFGGLVGGIFTFAGVKLSLDHQENLVKYDVESHRNMLLLQLELSFLSIDTLEQEGEKYKTTVFPVIVFDNDWHTHLPYIKCLNQTDLKNIAIWFTGIQDLEKKAQYAYERIIYIDFVMKNITNRPDIKLIIDKMKSDIS